MAIEMVRIPSETPNISNTDDFISIRHSYGDRDGCVYNKGNECSYTINGSVFKINSGRLVLQGVECDVDANGVEISVDNISTKRYYSVYLQVNLAINEVKILTTYDTSSYPEIDTGDDLIKNSVGTARLELYTFEVVDGVIDAVSKKFNSLIYYGKPLENYDNDKGTIETRLKEVEKSSTWELIYAGGAVSSGSTINFLKKLSVGDKILIGSTIYTVQSGSLIITSMSGGYQSGLYPWALFDTSIYYNWKSDLSGATITGTQDTMLYTSSNTWEYNGRTQMSTIYIPEIYRITPTIK